jgi:hypothetical protein
LTRQNTTDIESVVAASVVANELYYYEQVEKTAPTEESTTSIEIDNSFLLDDQVDFSLLNSSTLADKQKNTLT